MKPIRSYNSKALAQTFEQTAQIQATIEQTAKDAETDEFPASLIPTQLLYDIVNCYNVMYNTLTEAHLIKDGHIKPSATIH